TFNPLFHGRVVLHYDAVVREPAGEVANANRVRSQPRLNKKWEQRYSTQIDDLLPCTNYNLSIYGYIENSTINRTEAATSFRIDCNYIRFFPSRGPPIFTTTT